MNQPLIDIEWTPGSHPPEEEELQYWAVIRHISSGDTFVGLHWYLESVKGWSEIDPKRFTVLAFSKAHIPAVPAAYKS